MSTYENTVNSGHPTAGIAFAILGIIIAVLFSLFFGVAAGAAAALLGLGAVLLGIRARKSGRGTGAIVTGALAMVLAAVMSFTSVGLMKEMHRTAGESGAAPVFTEAFDNPYLGVAGMFLKVGNDEAKLKALTEEMNALLEYSGKTAAPKKAFDAAL